MERLGSIISLGGGVQSSTLCMMVETGEIEKPIAAVFADTGHEPQAVMDYIDWLDGECDFPVVRVQYADLGDDTIGLLHGKQTRGSTPPLFIASGKKRAGMLPRQCTHKYKIAPVQMWVKENVFGIHRRAPWPLDRTIDMHLGITTDEMERMKESGRPALRHTFPFIDDLNMSRADCLAWAAKHGAPQPPKSACYFCPYASDGRWAWLKENDQDSWDRAVAFDKKLRYQPREKGEAYLHRQCIPLDQVNLPEPDDGDDRSFLGECDGMCGV